MWVRVPLRAFFRGLDAGMRGSSWLRAVCQPYEGRIPEMTPFPVSRLPAVNVSTVPQRSPLRYPGGKTWLIPHIREWLASANAKILIEPFAGGGIVSLTAVMERFVEYCVMVELDRDVAAFWHAALRDGGLVG